MNRQLNGALITSQTRKRLLQILRLKTKTLNGMSRKNYLSDFSMRTENIEACYFHMGIMLRRERKCLHGGAFSGLLKTNKTRSRARGYNEGGNGTGDKLGRSRACWNILRTLALLCVENESIYLQDLSGCFLGIDYQGARGKSKRQ